MLKIAFMALSLVALVGTADAGTLEPEADYGGRIQPIYVVTDHPVPAPAQKLSLGQLEHDIMVAGARRHWRFETVKPGELHATYDNGKHAATVDIAFSPQAYSIHLVQSRNLLQNGDMIHRTYNRWVHNLEKDIDDTLADAGTEGR